MGSSASILLLENDVTASVEAFRREPIALSVETDSSSALSRSRTEHFDLLIADWALAGHDFCRQVARELPVIITTRETGGEGELARVLALESGADDALARPFSAREIIARVKAVLRRTARSAAPSRIEAGSVTVDLAAHSAWFEGRELPLTRYELALLTVLVRNAGRALTRESLMELAKGSADAAFDRSIDVHVCRLRLKLGDDPRRPRILKTIRGTGYLLVAA